MGKHSYVDAFGGANEAVKIAAKGAFPPTIVAAVADVNLRDAAMAGEAQDGIYGVFAIAAMDGVSRHVMTEPLFTLELFLLIVVLSVALIGVSILVFWRAGLDRGLVIGLLSAFRNIGVIMAALGATLPDMAWFYFAMVQFPIYLLPVLLKPLARRYMEKR